MTLLVPVLILAILVLAWIGWLAFGPRSTPVVPSYFSHSTSYGEIHRENDANEPDPGPSRPGTNDTEHLQNRLHASIGQTASLNGNALHLELRPALHNYSTAMGRNAETPQA